MSGDWSFIPSDWKVLGDEDPAFGIPTTYYGSVQLTGTARAVTDADGVAEVLRAQLRALQPDAIVADPMQHGPKLGVIQGLRIDVIDVRAKFKYGGNVDEAHRRAVAARLQQRAGPGDAAAVEHVLRRLQRP